MQLATDQIPTPPPRRTEIICEHDRPKDICAKCYPPPVVDRSDEFDQTVRHTHDAETCPACRREVEEAGRDARPQARQPFEIVIDAFGSGAERNALQEKLAVAEKRIAGFETLLKSLAEKIDGMQADVIFLTGKTFDEWLAEFRDAKLAESKPCPVPRCVLPITHTGQCSTTKAAA